MVTTVTFEVKDTSTMLTRELLVFSAFVIHLVEPFKKYTLLFMLYLLKWLQRQASNLQLLSQSD